MSRETSHYRRKTRKFLEVDYKNNGSEYTDYDPLVLLFELGPSLVDWARTMRRYATSYRHLKVGACALLNNIEGQKIRAVGGYNDTAFQGDDKHCAEMRSFGRGKRDDFKQREAIVVAAPTDSEVIYSVNDVRTPTLYPCSHCTGFLENATVVVTVGEEVDTYEVHTGLELNQIRDAISNQTKRSQKRGELPFEVHPINDPNFVHWTGSRSMYEEQVNGLQIVNYEEFRLARAEAAVTALRSGA